MEVSEFLDKLSPDEKKWLEFAVDKDWRLQVTNPKVVGYNPTWVTINFFNPRLMKDEKCTHFALYPIKGLDYFRYGDDCAHKYKDNGWIRDDGKHQDSLSVVPTFKWICVERPDENVELCGQVIAMVPVCENIEDMFAYMTYLKDEMGDPIGIGKDRGDAKIAAICFQLVTLFHFREKHSAFRFYINREENKKAIEDFMVEKFGLQNTWPHQMVNWLKAYPFCGGASACLYRCDLSRFYDNDLEYLLK